MATKVIKVKAHKRLSGTGKIENVDAHLREIEKRALLLDTSKKMNSAMASKNYTKAYSLLKIGNSLRGELGQTPLTLPNLESRFKK